jgi:hypothetical protein
VAFVGSPLTPLFWYPPPGAIFLGRTCFGFTNNISDVSWILA